MVEGGEDSLTRGTRDFWGVMEMFQQHMVVMAVSDTTVNALVKTHQTAHLKLVNVTIYRLYLTLARWLS